MPSPLARRLAMACAVIGPSLLGGCRKDEAVIVGAFTDTTCGCFVVKSGTVRCTGPCPTVPDEGGLRRDHPSRWFTSTSLAGATDVRITARHACASFGERGIRCWGDSDFPPESPPQLHGATGLAIAYGHLGCAVARDATVWCWGDRALWEGRQVSSEISARLTKPVPMPGLAGAVELAAGSDFMCARLHAGAVWCWGGNRLRELGRDTDGKLGQPAPVPLLAPATRISAAGSFACARHADGGVSCWGLKTRGAYTTERGVVPTRVPGLSDAVDVAVTEDLACALHADGHVSCWGTVYRPMAAPAPVDAPTRLPLSRIARILAGGQSFVGIDRDGRAFVWGSPSWYSGATSSDSPGTVRVPERSAD